jgi:hypothetical protein
VDECGLESYALVAFDVIGVKHYCSVTGYLTGWCISFSTSKLLHLSTSIETLHT